MVKVIGKEDSLKEIFKAARINTEFIEVTYGEGIVIIQPKRLQCVQCGCDDESKLIKRSGVLVCTDCINEMQDFVNRTKEL